MTTVTRDRHPSGAAVGQATTTASDNAAGDVVGGPEPRPQRAPIFTYDLDDRSRRATGSARPLRRPAAGLLGIVLLGLVATFFAWVSAEPLLLALGHGHAGTASVSRCTGHGVTQRCTGEFTGGQFTAEGVAVFGITDAQRRAKAPVPARMVGADSRRAYVGADGAGLHLRWGAGLTFLLICGAGIAWTSGARRLDGRQARRRAVFASVAAPLLLAVAFAAASW